MNGQGALRCFHLTSALEYPGFIVEVYKQMAERYAYLSCSKLSAKNVDHFFGLSILLNIDLSHVSVRQSKQCNHMLTNGVLYRLANSCSFFSSCSPA